MNHEKLFDLKGNGILNWLYATKGEVKDINPLEVFKNYRPLDRGNTKLAKNILSFNLLPVVTCEQLCDGCYDIRAMRYTSVRKKRYLNTSMALHNMELVEKMIVKQIINSRTCDFVRIHVGGDFYSSEYVELWGRITEQVRTKKPKIKFYTYTKTSFIDTLKSYGINVVLSKYNEGFNFGELEDMHTLAKKYKGIICPATLGKVSDGFCGSKCKACMNIQNVFFGKH